MRRRAGRGEKMFVRMAFMLPDELRRALFIAAKAEAKTASAFIRQALEQELAKRGITVDYLRHKVLVNGKEP